MAMRRYVCAVVVAVCLSLCLVAPRSVSAAELNVLEWLSKLPFPAPEAPSQAAYQSFALGPKEVVHAPSSSEGVPAIAGALLSDSFRSSGNRRGLFAQRDFANGTEIVKIAFDQMFNYSSTMAPGLPLDPHFSELILAAVHTGAVLDSQALLALRLLLQYQNHHEWKKSAADAGKLHWEALLADLPRPTSVCFYTQEELAELQIPIESPVFAARSQQLDTITESYLAFDTMLKEKPEYAQMFPSGFTEKWYRWAYGIVLNTAVEVPIHDEEGVQGALLVLVPAFNQLNHANPPYHNVKLQWNEDPTVTHYVRNVKPAVDAAAAADPTAPKKAFPHGHGSLSLIAVRDIKSGEELTITYGSLSAIPLLVVNETTHASTGLHAHDSVETHTSRDKAAHDSKESHFTAESFFQQLGLSNSQLLVHYGIALPTNEFERVALDIGLDADAVGVEEHHFDVLELKRQILDINELDHGTLIGLDGRLDPFFVQALRTKHLTAEDLAHLAGTEYEFSPEHGYLSLQNELKWQLQLVVSIENLLTAYPTTLAADLEQTRALLAQQGRGAHSTNVLHALAYRVALKRVLHSLILRSLQNIHELFLNVSTGWSEQLHKHNLEEEAQLRMHADLTPEAKATLLTEWSGEQATWFISMEEWKGEMDKWEATWNQWVQNAMGPTGLAASLPAPHMHRHATPDTLDELLDPSIHALQLEHVEETVDVDVEDKASSSDEEEADDEEEEEQSGHDEL